MSVPKLAALAAGVLGLVACQATDSRPPAALVFYPDPPDPPRMQFLRSIGGAADLDGERGGFDQLLFGAPLEAEPFRTPYGVLLHDGRALVCDMEQGALLELELATNRLAPLALDGRARMTKPVNLARADDGVLYVADLGRRQVVVLDGERRWQAEFGPWGEASRPVDVDVAGDELYVTDAGAACVRVLARADGVERRVLGQGVLRGPTNLALDADGNAYVVDTIDGRVAVFDRAGALVRHLGSPGSSVGNLARPKGIACFGELVFVNDAAFENCQIFDRAGNPLMFFGGPGAGPGCFNLPAGVFACAAEPGLFEAELAPDFEAEAFVVVTNFYGARLAFYALGKSKRFVYPD